jgi:hypothetical protein
MDTGTIGVKSGTLAVTTDDPDSLLKNVLLSGTVLAHAEASLDSVASVTTQVLDFGSHMAGQFTNQDVRVHNRDYDALQARLSVSSGVITGGAGRFTIVGGFSPALLAGTGRTYTVQFNDAGATQDSLYEATLTFSSSDEPLPGAAPAADLVVTLRAQPLSGATDAGDPIRPSALAFHPPYPNPLGTETWLGFDLPARAPVELAIYDLSGRRVASLISETLEANRYRRRWDANDERGGRVPAGLYFARFTTPGLSRTARLVVLP